MVRRLLVAGLLAGLCAALAATAFAFAVGEPQIGRAIAFEHATPHAAGEPSEAVLVSRDVQRTLGLLVALGIYGVAVGGLFALAFATLYGRVAAAGPAATARRLALAAFVCVFAVPFLKYPANPPSVGRPETIGTRTELYAVMVAISLLAAVAALRVARALAARRLRLATAGGVATYALLVAVAIAVLPGVHEVPAGFPAETLWGFRVAALGTQALLWTTLGLVFAVLAPRCMEPAAPLLGRRAPARRRRTA